MLEYQLLTMNLAHCTTERETTPHQDRGRARAAGYRFARDEKVPGPQLGAKQ